MPEDRTSGTPSVMAAAGQTARVSPPLERFEVEFRRRLSTLSRVQGLLSRSEREPITIGMLVRMELDAVAADQSGRLIRLDGPVVPLVPGVVQTMALALHELATNAVKHGALATSGAELDVSWRVWKAQSGSRLLLEWVENGVTLAPEKLADAPAGYGRELIEKALPYTLGAATSFKLKPGGVVCTIDLPLAASGEDYVA